MGILVAFQVDPNIFFSVPNNFNLTGVVGSSGAILSIFMWSLNPLSDFQCSTDKTRGYLARVVDTTNFVSTWVICGFLVFEIFRTNLFLATHSEADCSSLLSVAVISVAVVADVYRVESSASIDTLALLKGA